MSDKLIKLLHAVEDSASLLTFVHALRDDRAEEDAMQQVGHEDPFDPGLGEWANDSIKAFLDSATAWAESTDFGKSQGLPEENLWRRFATFLYCGKIYE